jgi:hypothetical protein
MKFSTYTSSHIASSLTVIKKKQMQSMKDFLGLNEGKDTFDRPRLITEKSTDCKTPFNPYILNNKCPWWNL